MEQISPNPRLSVRRMLRLTVLVAALCYAVASFLLIPLHVRLSSDVMYAETVWAMILYYLVGEETLLYLLVYAVCYPAAIYAVWIAGFKRAARVPVAFALLTLGRFVVDFCMNAIADGALPGADKFLQSELPIIAASYALEMIQYALVIAVALWVKHLYARKREYLEACAILEGKQAEPEAPILPFTRLISWKNPLQRSALFMAIVVAFLRLLTFQIYQITLFIKIGYSDGLLVMILDLISSVIIGALFYFAAILLINRFAVKDAESAEVK